MLPPNLLPHSGTAFISQNFLSSRERQVVLKSLQNEIDWKQYPITLFGKEYLQPRLIAFIADKGINYAYSGNKPLLRQEWTDSLLLLKKSIQSHLGVDFNCVLANWYRHGSDSMGLHADNEPSLGPNPTIASYSLGATRRMRFVHNKTKERVDIDLHNNSLLTMDGEVQSFWKHEIPKSKKITEPRWNLTFRKIIA